MNYHRMSTEHLRNIFLWKTYGKRGTSAPQTVLLKHMTEKHLRNCLKNERISRSTRAIFGRELRYRMSKGITDKDNTQQIRGVRRRFGLHGQDTEPLDIDDMFN